MTAFAHAVDALFFDDNLAEDGTFTASPNPPVPVRVMRSRIDEPWNHTRSPGWKLHLSRAQVPTKPVEGCTLTVGSTTYIVRSVAEDVERTEWTFDVDEVVP